MKRRSVVERSADVKKRARELMIERPVERGESKRYVCQIIGGSERFSIMTLPRVRFLEGSDAA